MNQVDHEKRCIETLGEPFAEVHAFLDRYYPEFRSRMHWLALHHQRGLEIIVERFGERAKAAAELHILDDLGRIPADWDDMDDCWLPLTDREEQRVVEIIKDLYGVNVEL